MKEYEERRKLERKWSQDKAYQEWLGKEFREDRADRIRKKLPGLLKKGNMVWCRNGAVIGIATPCLTLGCQYKTSPNDVVNGAAKCQNFQVTTKSWDWDHAEHVCEGCDVTPFRGW